MLLHSGLNEWRISQLEKLDMLYNNYASSRILERSKNDFILYKNEIFPKISHIHLRAFDSV